MAKTPEQELAELEKAVEEKKAELEKKRVEASFQEYPKYIAEADVTVQNAEEEKRVTKGIKKGEYKEHEPTAAEIRAQKDAEADRGKK